MTPAPPPPPRAEPEDSADRSQQQTADNRPTTDDAGTAMSNDRDRDADESRDGVDNVAYFLKDGQDDADKPVSNGNGRQTVAAAANAAPDRYQLSPTALTPAQFEMNYGSSTAFAQDAGAMSSKDNLLMPRAWIGSRHVVTFMLFLGMANAYIMRTNMSVAIVAMVNQSALMKDPTVVDDECNNYNSSGSNDTSKSNDGTFLWSTSEQGYVLSSFFYGYVITQIPFGILSKKYGAKYFLGVGMLINSVFGFLVPWSANFGILSLIAIRFIQGLGEGPIVPCTHALLAKWIPPNERSRMGAFVYAGAQFGTVISMPLSGVLSEYGFAGGWPSIFYVFGAIGTLWSVAFLWLVHEDPESHPTIPHDERKYIISSVWGAAGVSSPPVPWRSILKSAPFWAILVAHMGQNYGYETLMTELPTYMKQVLHFNIKANGLFSSLPYLAMWMFSMVASTVADMMISSEKFSHTHTRKIVNSIGQYGPAIALIAASFTGCNPYLTVAILTVGVGFNGAIYSGFKVNHLDISPRFAGILMSLTNCLANLAGLLAPIVAGYVIDKRPTQAAWRVVFVASACVYIVCSTIYIILGDGTRQPWDNPSNDQINMEHKKNKKLKQKINKAGNIEDTVQ